jgi:hypothetical protein
MSNKDLNAERRKLLASAMLSMGFLHVNGFLQHAEVERIYARIRRYRPDGTRGDSPGCGSILIAFGEDNAEVLRTCDIAGKYVRIY